MITRQQIHDALTAAGVKHGDHLIVHSSLRSVGPIDGGADALIDGLLDAVGRNGTLAMPAFNYTRPLPEPYFDPAVTPGKTGMLTEIFRKRPGVLRSLHPAHSMSIHGPRAAEFIADHRTSFGVGTPIDRIAQAGGYVLLLGVTHTSNSTIHVGDSHGGAVRFWWYEGDPPTAKVRLPDGRIVEHQFDVSSSCSMAFNAVDLPLRRAGAIRDLRIGQALSHLMHGADIIRAIVELTRTEPTVLFCTRPDCRPCVMARKHIQSKGGNAQ